MSKTSVKARLQTVGRQTLTYVVRQALGNEDAKPVDWSYEPLVRGTGTATGGVYLFAGSAQIRGTLSEWKLILKVVAIPDQISPQMARDASHQLYWKREPLAFQSGLFDDLPGGLRPPRCFYMVEEGESVWLWLEHLEDGYGGEWPIEQYGRAARCLGRFNGAYLAGLPMPSYPWLNRTGSQRGRLAHSSSIRDVIANRQTWENPLLRAAFQIPVAERLLKLWEDKELLFDALDRLPHTLCHQDAWKGNMFAPSASSREDGLAMIDWAYVGRAVVGTDPTDLFAASAMWLTAEPGELKGLDDTIFENYIRGLEDAGWRGDRQVVRFAYSACGALKYGCVPVWVPDVLDEGRHAYWESFSARSMGEFVRQQSALTCYLLDLADEARGLLNSLRG